MDGRFYRGLPQVCIKDAIFQPSTSFNHATELMQMFQAKPEVVKPVLIITKNGGAATPSNMRGTSQQFWLINFQKAAYRSANHLVEKINCILWWSI